MCVYIHLRWSPLDVTNIPRLELNTSVIYRLHYCPFKIPVARYPWALCVFMINIGMRAGRKLSQKRSVWLKIEQWLSLQRWQNQPRQRKYTVISLGFATRSKQIAVIHGVYRSQTEGWGGDVWSPSSAAINMREEPFSLKKLSFCLLVLSLPVVSPIVTAFTLTVWIKTALLASFSQYYSQHEYLRSNLATRIHLICHYLSLKAVHTLLFCLASKSRLPLCQLPKACYQGLRAATPASGRSQLCGCRQTVKVLLQKHHIWMVFLFFLSTLTCQIYLTLERRWKSRINACKVSTRS